MKSLVQKQATNGKELPFFTMADRHVFLFVSETWRSGLLQLVDLASNFKFYLKVCYLMGMQDFRRNTLSGDRSR